MHQTDNNTASSMCGKDDPENKQLMQINFIDLQYSSYNAKPKSTIQRGEVRQSIFTSVSPQVTKNTIFNTWMHWGNATNGHPNIHISYIR